MTKSQEKMIESLKKAILEFDTHGSKELIATFKKIEIEDLGYAISFYVVTGFAEDEGTLAEALCRNFRHIMIGKRGGLKIFTQTSDLKSVSFESAVQTYRR